MLRFALLPVLLAFACMLAGLYGFLHNQISYTVAPTYLHDFKFRQFRIDSDLCGRIGAGIVGFLASWWMGIIIGMPIYLAALFLKGLRPFVTVFVIAALVVVTTTLRIGISALVVSFATLSASGLPHWVNGREAGNPLAFAHAGTIHSFSYVGGLIGVVSGSAYTIC